VYRSFITNVSLAAITALALAACNTSAEQVRSIGEAYVGPATLKVRSDIPLQSSVVATVKHGDRLEILQKRRRFLRVRTPAGAVGWTDERQLLAASDMKKLKDLAARAASMPIQGQATTFSDLNVHTQPSRESPSFLQVKENEKVDVLMHVTAPRAEVARAPLIRPTPKKVKTGENKPPKEVKYPPLAPLPKPPGPPENWVELSRTDVSADRESLPQEVVKEEKPVPMDDWSLIRIKSGQSGWVLTRRLVMAIPDDVAQYAEGHRIVSYFALGEVKDGDQTKRNWLWTTIGDGIYPYDFNSFRVFIWSLRRHRYETAYIDRNLRGYAPVVLKEVQISTPKGKTGTDVVKYPGFSICVEKKDGQRFRREFAFITNIVRLVGESPCETSEPAVEVAAQAPLPVAAEPQQTESLMQRFKRRLHALTRGRIGG
jgi:SH3-like domain-containing protein